MEFFTRRRFSRTGRTPRKGVCTPKRGVYAPKRGVYTPSCEAGGKGKIGDAYFTVEAALVFPMVMSTILFVVFMLLFQYNRCLLEQDLGAIALWGSSQETSDMTELEEKIRERIAGIYHDKYVAWEITELEISLEKNHFFVQGGGRVTFPVFRWSFWSGENVWDMEAHYSCRRLSPVTFIRLCHGLEQFLKEKDVDEGAGVDVNMATER